ncbi:hypothetical protein [Streptomyces decoyicus]|uniref:hypothetical protein n=1 Tax=Streptomyces decoyicus TaxID=249567 RepID=UPI00386A134E
MKMRKLAGSGIAGAALITTTLTGGIASANTLDTTESTTKAVSIQAGAQGWHVKNAKNVADTDVPKPSRSVVCTFVSSDGGSKIHGEVCFDPDGDQFYVKDSRADGMSIYMRAMYTGNMQTIFDCRDYLGGAKGWTVCDFSSEMKEGRSINFTALAYEGNNAKYKGMTATAQN